MTAIEYFIDELLGAAPDGAAPRDVEALAADALDRGLPQATPEAVVAFVSVADCTSRNPVTQQDLVHAKICRLGIDITSRLQEITSDLGMPRPELHIRLRDSPALLSGHGLDIWPRLSGTICHAVRAAGAARTTLPVVCWNHAQFAEMLPDVSGTLEHADIRMDFSARPADFDLQCLSTALLVTRCAPSTRFVLSNQRAACPTLHPEAVEFRAQSSLADLSTDLPAVRHALTRTLARTNRHLASAMAAARPHWYAGPAHMEWRSGLDAHVTPSPDTLATHLGWPTPPGGPASVTLRPDTTPDHLEATLSRSLSEPGYMVVSGERS